MKINNKNKKETQNRLTYSERKTVFLSIVDQRVFSAEVRNSEFEPEKIF